MILHLMLMRLCNNFDRIDSNENGYIQGYNDNADITIMLFLKKIAFHICLIAFI